MKADNQPVATLNPVSVHVRLEKGGTLSEILGDRKLEIDSIYVSGPMNSEDFKTLWESTFYGRLAGIDLTQTSVEGNTIPEGAFFNKEEQFDRAQGLVYATHLKKLLFPEGITTIGKYACGYSVNLLELYLPSTVKEIGDCAFTYCVQYAPEKLVLPEALESIGYQAFYYCPAMKCDVVFPVALKHIGWAAFYQCGITGMNKPESLATLAGFAFYGCDLVDITLPTGCRLDANGCQFLGNHRMKKAHLPEDAPYIPQSMFQNCYDLEEINIPLSLEWIGEEAFSECWNLKELTLPEGLTTIEESAFNYCESLQTMTIPSTVTRVGPGLFSGCSGLKEIYCRPQVPPTIIPGWAGGMNVFAGLTQKIPVYIPIGSGALYREAEGWGSWTEYVETQLLTKVTTLPGCNSKEDDGYYDFTGRSVAVPEIGKPYIHQGRKIIYSSGE